MNVTDFTVTVTAPVVSVRRSRGHHTGTSLVLPSRDAELRSARSLRSSTAASARRNPVGSRTPRPGYARSSPASRGDRWPTVRGRRPHRGPSRRRSVRHRWDRSGGPHTLACAALLPERVTACAAVAGVGPWEPRAWISWRAWRRRIATEFGAGALGERGCLAGVCSSPDCWRWPTSCRGTGRCIPSAGSFRSSTGGVVPGSSPSTWPRCSTMRFATGSGVGSTTTYAFTQSVGVRRLGDPGSGVGVAGRAGSDGAVRARSVVGGGASPMSRPMLRPEHGHLSLAVAAFDEILDDLMAISEA